MVRNDIDINRNGSFIGKIRKTFRMRSARHVVELRQIEIARQQQQQALILMNQQQHHHHQQTLQVAPSRDSIGSTLLNINRILNDGNILKLILPLLQFYTPTSTSNSDNGSTNNNNTPLPSPFSVVDNSSSLNDMAIGQQLILAALIEMRNSITPSSTTNNTNNIPSTTSQPMSSSTASHANLPSTTTTTLSPLPPIIGQPQQEVPSSNNTNNNSSSTNTCQCIHCQLQLYIKATVTKVFENLLLTKELKENRTAHTMTFQEKECISKDLLESEEFSERIRLFQSLNNSSLIQVESIVRNNMELFVMISNVIPQQRSVYIASFDLSPSTINK